MDNYILKIKQLSACIQIEIFLQQHVFMFFHPIHLTRTHHCVLAEDAF